MATIGDTTYKLFEPFLVLATQNPIEQEGTYPTTRGAGRQVYVESGNQLSFKTRGTTDYQAKYPHSVPTPVINPVASTSEILTAKELV